MKISIITAVFNRVNTIAQAVNSVNDQNFSNFFLEHIIIDGESNDGTLDVLNKLKSLNTTIVSEQDNGIYDALNKGFLLASGNIIGIMHSDDFYVDNNVLTDVAAAFSDPKIDIVYGNLDYIDANNSEKIIRRWNSKKYYQNNLWWGWMPPHPTVFIRSTLLNKFGTFDTRYGVSADYDLILRIFANIDESKVFYIKRVLVKMRVGGESNKSLLKIIKKMKEDYLIIKQNKVGGLTTLFLKNARKLNQFWN